MRSTRRDLRERRSARRDLSKRVCPVLLAPWGLRASSKPRMDPLLQPTKLSAQAHPVNDLVMTILKMGKHWDIQSHGLLRMCVRWASIFASPASHVKQGVQRSRTLH